MKKNIELNNVKICRSHYLQKKITRRLSAASEIIFEGVLGMFALLT